MSVISNSLSTKHLFFAGLLGAAIASVVQVFIAGAADQELKMVVMENRIKALEALLEQKDQQINSNNWASLQGRSLIKSSYVGGENRVATTPKSSSESLGESGTAETVVDSNKMLKDLGTRSVNDPRSFSEKVSDLLANDASEDKVAIVSRGIFDLAGDRENLPDYALQSLYNNQSNPDVKRVIAQVLSQRGNNTMMENHIAEARGALKSENPTERQRALQQLAKTHHVSAATLVAPMLKDGDINVRLDALLALRATGNQSHLALVESLVNDKDEAIRSLATDVASHLRTLSEHARTSLSSSDIATELPIMSHP